MKNNLYIFLLLFLMTILNCCISNHQKETYKKSYKEKSISMESLRNEIRRDSTHYKLLFFYDPFCLPCVMHIDSFVQPFIASYDTSIVKVWLIAENHLYEEEVVSFLSEHRIPFNEVSHYNIDDTTHKFSCTNPNQWDNITNFLFDLKDSIIGLNGLPLYLISDRNNNLMIKDSVITKDTLSFPIQLYELSY